MSKILVTIFWLSLTITTHAQFRNYGKVNSNYEEAYQVISRAIEGQLPMSFKNAVFLVESTYYDHQLDTIKLNKSIKSLASL